MYLTCTKKKNNIFTCLHIFRNKYTYIYIYTSLSLSLRVRVLVCACCRSKHVHDWRRLPTFMLTLTPTIGYSNVSHRSSGRWAGLTARCSANCWKSGMLQGKTCMLASTFTKHIKWRICWSTEDKKQIKPIGEESCKALLPPEGVCLMCMYCVAKHGMIS